VEPITPELVLVDPGLARAIRQELASVPFRVAFVCTGNRFRSVLAEAAFRSVTGRLPVEVESYGILDVGSTHPLPEAVRTAEAYGLGISSHVGRSLVAADLSQSSLVVGFEPQHITAAIEIAGARAERAFLLRELVDLLQQIGVDTRSHPIERAIETIARAHSRRLEEPRRWIGREIGDPIGLSEREQRAIGQAVCDGATRMAHELFGPSASL
jgi:protein-tyrosine-phosphatase